MPENTLLSLLSGGRYGTSADLPPLITPDSPTLRETAHSFMDDLIANQESEMSQVLFPAREGAKTILGTPAKDLTQGDLYSMMTGVGGFAMKIPPAFKGENLMTGFIKSLQKESSQVAVMQKNALSMINKLEKTGVKRIPNPKSGTPEAALDNQWKRLYRIDDKMTVLQAYEKALEQYGKLGSVRPNTQEWIQELISGIKRPRI